MDCCEILKSKTYKIAGDTPLVLPKGWFVWKIVVRSSTPQTIELGTTVGGTQILMSTLLVANAYLSVTQDVFPVAGNPVIIYPTGVTAYTEITVYKLKL